MAGFLPLDLKQGASGWGFGGYALPVPSSQQQQQRADIRAAAKETTCAWDSAGACGLALEGEGDSAGLMLGHGQRVEDLLLAPAAGMVVETAQGPDRWLPEVEYVNEVDVGKVVPGTRQPIKGGERGKEGVVVSRRAEGGRRVGVACGPSTNEYVSHFIMTTHKRGSGLCAGILKHEY